MNFNNRVEVIWANLPVEERLPPRVVYMLAKDLLIMGKARDYTGFYQTAKILETQVSFAEFGGLLLLHTMPGESASRVLEALNPNFHFENVRRVMADIFECETVPNKQKKRRRRRRKNHNIICYRCQASGHKSDYCPAPAPVPPTAANNIDQPSNYPWSPGMRPFAF